MCIAPAPCHSRDRAAARSGSFTRSSLVVAIVVGGVGGGGATLAAISGWRAQSTTTNFSGVSSALWVVTVKNMARQIFVEQQLNIPSYHLCSECRVRFDSEVHLGEMDKKVHLSEVDSPYVGIR